MFSNPVMLLYDNEASDLDLAQAAAQAVEDQLNQLGADAGDPPPVQSPGQPSAQPNKDDVTVIGDPAARFTTDQVNQIVQDRLAKDRKKRQEEGKKLEQAYQDLLANQTLTEEDRQRLQGQLEDLRKQHRTKEQQAAFERKQLQEEYERRLEDSSKAAVHWENKYKTSMVNRSLMDAAVKHDAFIPDQVVTILRERTKLVQPVDESGKPVEGELIPMVDLPDVDADTGQAIMTQRTPDEAVERLTELQPNLFKSNVVSGVGGNSATGGVSPGVDGSVDVSKLTTAQYIELYKKDPTKVGIRPRKVI